MARFLTPQSFSFVQFSALLILFFSPCSAGWALQDDYTPSNWFSMFDFFTDADPTHGSVSYKSQSAAQQEGLINTNNNQIYMGVDHTNLAPNGRGSVRLTSRKSYNAGTLMILDLAHMPVGMGTWPAFWTVGPNWPAGGEIDIIEGVHNQATNAMTLHTADGCSISNNGGFLGSITTSNCYVYAPGQTSNAGCSIGTSNTNTYGSGLNAAGGGVYAMVWTTSTISIYFFQRGQIPSDITSGKPDVSGWGKPLSEFSGSCDIPKFFQNNQIVFDTTFCGDWAGNVWAASGGLALAPTCNSYVANNPGAFTNAYWKINSLKVYTVSTSAPATTSASSSDVPATTEEEGQNNNNNNNSQDDNNHTQNDNNNDQKTNDNDNNNQATSISNNNNNHNAPTATQGNGNIVAQVTGNSGVVVGSDDDKDSNSSSNDNSNSVNNPVASSNGNNNQQSQSGSSNTQTGSAESSGQVSTGSSTSGTSGTVNSGTTTTGSTSPADNPPQNAFDQGGVIMESDELKLKAREPTSRPTGDLKAHMRREKRDKAQGARHRRHGKRHVQPVGPPGGAWRR